MNQEHKKYKLVKIRFKSSKLGEEFVNGVIMGLMVDESIEIQNLIRENQRLQSVISEQAERFESVINEQAERFESVINEQAEEIRMLRAALNANQK